MLNKSNLTYQKFKLNFKKLIMLIEKIKFFL